MYQQIHVDEEVAGLHEDSWMHRMRRRLVFGSDGPKHEEHLIYRVHSGLRNVNAMCYEPIGISIGPYHHGKKHLLDMETHKERYFRHLLSRNENVRFEDLVKMMKEIEEQVRACYPDEIDEIESDAFVEMMLLDGCFIVELLLKLEHWHHDDDLIVGPPWRLVLLKNRDLLLLENQLPFFLLQKIFKAVMPHEDHSAFVKLSFNFLQKYIMQTGLIVIDPPTDPESVHHLLHLWHTHLIRIPGEQLQKHLIGILAEELQKYLIKIPDEQMRMLIGIPAEQHQEHLIRILAERLIGIPAEQLQEHPIRIPAEQHQEHLIRILAKQLIEIPAEQLQEHLIRILVEQQQEQQKLPWMPSATQLEEAGVKFEASSNNNFLDIKFYNGVMKIPTIIVHLDTETQLRNLLAFEQCCLPFNQYYLSAYVSFLDFLINTSKDIEILNQKGILTHWLGEDEQVARLFNNNLEQGLIGSRQNYLSATMKRVNDYRSRKINKWRASLVRDYFYSPWAVLSFVAAIVALTLTVIQTVYSVQPK